MKPRALMAVAVVGGVALAWAAWAVGRGDDASPGATSPGATSPGARATLSVAEALGGADTAGYARATEPRSFRFPEDHGPHPDYRTEWWYVTGHLETEEGRRFGVQLTVFRSALAPEAPAAGTPPGDAPAGSAPEADARPSAWTTRQAWMAHLAVTDVEAGRFHGFERFERGAVGLAGARVEPFRVWVGDWEMRGPSEDRVLPARAAGGFPPGDASASIFPLSLSAREGEVALELDLSPAKPLVLQGEEGLSRKGPAPGNASYYYSFTRLQARGDVTTPAGRFPVTGTAWLDREWSTSSLPAGVVGWDWFALQMDDGRDLMLNVLRQADGAPSPHSGGVMVSADGTPERVSAETWNVEVLDRWTSPVDGAAYPSAWRVRVPAHGLDVRVRPLLPHQELDVTFRYWEGAVEVTGRDGNGPVTGRGYVELTGYAGSGRPRG